MPLPRLQLFEFNDLDAAPAPLRDVLVESLSRALRWGRMVEGLAGPLRRFLAEAGTEEILDLCAGAGGPADALADALERSTPAGMRPPRIVLSDLYPRLEAWRVVRDRHPRVIDLVAEPIDATRIPADLARGRARTIINAFHHFPPPLAAAILADAVRGSAGIFVSEAFDRTPLGLRAFAPVGVAALVATPLLTPRDRLAKALLTWATPIALLAGIWDGLVSTMRIYRPEDIARMVAPFGGHWQWRFGSYEYGVGGRGQWFYGVPRTS